MRANQDEPEPSGDPDEVQRLLDDCLSAEPGEWRAALDAACAGHPDLAAELRRRFATLERAGMVETPLERSAADGSVQRFGGFDLLRLLGQGGMGVVHLARQRGTDREVALKVIRPELLGLE
ncbi:MAG: hypothetical protein KAI24_25595, partial [Planctomycetes bacterium]|nr:hypothetical protein [Planctomycetota bacterium]